LFPNKKVEWKLSLKYEDAKRESNTLYNIWIRGQDTEDINVTRVSFIGQVKLDYVDIVNTFNTIHCNDHIEFIQLVEDRYHIMYKLRKQHDIQYNKLQEWSNFIPKSFGKHTIPSFIVLMFRMKQNQYIKATLDMNGKITIQCRIDSKIDDIMKYIKTQVITWFKLHIDKSVTIIQDSVYANSDFPLLNNMSLDTCIKLLGKQHLIFHLNKKHIIFQIGTPNCIMTSTNREN
jgi:hypothetical protein